MSIPEKRNRRSVTLLSSASPCDLLWPIEPPARAGGALLAAAGDGVGARRRERRLGLLLATPEATMDLSTSVHRGFARVPLLEGGEMVKTGYLYRPLGIQMVLMFVVGNCLIDPDRFQTTYILPFACCNIGLFFLGAGGGVTTLSFLGARCSPIFTAFFGSPHRPLGGV